MKEVFVECKKRSRIPRGYLSEEHEIDFIVLESQRLYWSASSFEIHPLAAGMEG